MENVGCEEVEFGEKVGFGGLGHCLAYISIFFLRRYEGGKAYHLWEILLIA